MKLIKCRELLKGNPYGLITILKKSAYYAQEKMLFYLLSSKCDFFFNKCSYFNQFQLSYADE